MKNFIKNSIVASMVAMAITACGGGSSGGNNNNNGGGGEVKAALKFTPVTDVTSVVGTQGIQFASVRKSSGIDFISSAYADDITTTVTLQATTATGSTFNVGFTDEEGNPASETVTPSGMVRLDDDHAMVELFVMVDKATNLHEYRHYLVEYSTGKMILVETLKSIANGWNLDAQYYAAGPNSLHNATNDIIYRKEDDKWYKLTPNWDDLTFTEVYYTDGKSNERDDLVLDLPTANGDLFTVADFKAYLNGNDLGLQYVISVFQKDGQVYVATASKLYTVTDGTPVEVASLPENNISINPVVAFDGNTIYTDSCTSLVVNGSELSYSYIPADRDTVGYDVVVAGDSMMCTGHPRSVETEAAEVKTALKATARAASNDFAGTDAVCDAVQSWEEKGGVRLVQVEGGSEKVVKGATGAQRLLPMSRNTAYLSQNNCVPAGGDGVTAPKWEISQIDSKVDFVNNEISALSAPVVMSIVN